MSETTGHEIKVEEYVQKNLSDLHLPLIPLTFPTLGGETMLMSVNDVSDGLTGVIVEVQEPGERFIVSRRDGHDMQVKDDTAYGRPLFKVPIAELTLVALESCIWHVDIDKQNIIDYPAFENFVSHISHFAHNEQERLY